MNKDEIKESLRIRDKTESTPIVLDLNGREDEYIEALEYASIFPGDRRGKLLKDLASRIRGDSLL